ncbi:MAG: RNA pseudouridine synthase [Candidatus Berkelbacteria bacterium]|nr:MAG: RNA pseudouridine synthase [Candidatus Berkelbacteria bacterium]QQG51420.1 MAG: RNA pseudouridine synthase [Candidatus Berkelbacteria bacterium]
MKPAIIAETNDYLVINKPAGMATEPPSDRPTLRDWLIEAGQIRAGEWAEDKRCGVVHRLDTDTSGVILWAKSESAQASLQQLWQGRQVKKTYLALVAGRSEQTGVIEAAIERDNRNDRQRVTHLPTTKSRSAITEYKTLGHAKVGEREVSLISAHPITGRTHQIRVHLKSIGHPIIGDKLYGEKSSDEISRTLGLKRQFLHAFSLELPDNKTYQANLPSELTEPLRVLDLLGKI